RGVVEEDERPAADFAAEERDLGTDAGSEAVDGVLRGHVDHAPSHASNAAESDAETRLLVVRYFPFGSTPIAGAVRVVTRIPPRSGASAASTDAALPAPPTTSTSTVAASVWTAW